MLTLTVVPRRANYVIAVDGFIHREGLLRAVGGIAKRKFTNDTTMVKHLLYTLRTLKQVLVLYPEARYSLCGTQSTLPDSLGKLAQLARVPVVMLRMNGTYTDRPVWDLRPRGNPIEAWISPLFQADEAASLPLTEVNERLRRAFQFDDYAWMKQRGIRIRKPFRAEGLHRILYHCPHCGTESAMDSQGTELFCGCCGVRYEFEETGDLRRLTPLAEGNRHPGFTRVPDWYDWERAQVRQQVLDGTYHFEDRVVIDSLPNARGFIPLGEGTLVHTSEGFRLVGQSFGQPLDLRWPTATLYSVHIEYDYNGRGDGLDLTTLDDCYYCYPLTKRNVVTKIHFAVEESFDCANQPVDGPVEALARP